MLACWTRPSVLKTKDEAPRELLARAAEASVANVPANLLLVTAARDVANANWRPAEFGHNLRKVPVCAGSTITLWNFQDVHEPLRVDALQAIEPRFPAHALKPQAPRVYGLRGLG